MSYPMNEFETDLEKPYTPSKEWLACWARASETEGIRPLDDGIAAVIEPASHSQHAVAAKLSKRPTTENTIPSGHSQTRILAGFGVGALLGYFVASRHNGKPA